MKKTSYDIVVIASLAKLSRMHIERYKTYKMTFKKMNKTSIAETIQYTRNVPQLV